MFFKRVMSISHVFGYINQFFVIIDVIVYIAADSSGIRLAGALFQDSTANALAAGTTLGSSATAGLDKPLPIVFKHYMSAGTTSATTFKVRVGPTSSTATTVNGTNGNREFGGVFSSSITVTEIQG